MSLVTELRSAGLTVVEDPGWDTRGLRWAANLPIGQMLHHTAPPVPYPVDALNGSRDGRIKCNANIKQDGTVVMIAALASNYSSGLGSEVVYRETLAAIPPPANALQRNLADDMNGNPFYWNVECDALGDGGPIPAVMYDAIVTATNVTNRWFGFKGAQVISHAEWTRRKIDPYWNGSTRTAADIRADLEDDDMPTANEIATAVWSARFGTGSGVQTAGERLYLASSGATSAANNTAVIIAMIRDLTLTLTPEQLDALALAIANELDDELAASVWAYLCERIPGTG